jgi:transposase-like protein
MPRRESIPDGHENTIEIDLERTLEEIAREGARRVLQAALEAEVDEHVSRLSHLRDVEGRQMVVRNGHGPERIVQTAVGSLPVRRPRIDERKAVSDDKDHERFSSAILPRFLRRTPTLEGTIATLYLKGISTNDFPTALAGILGEGAKGLSPTTITRLKQVWEQEYQQWRTRPLGASEYAYIWADGVHFNVRLEDERSCMLVVVGANFQGQKELLAVRDGYRESEHSWKELLLELKHRGLEIDPKLAIADGATGFWKALRQVYPTTRHGRCWVHKTANILEKMPKSLQGRAKSMIHDIYRAETKQAAQRAYRHFLEVYEEKYPSAAECLKKDEEEMFAFFDFPAAHWQHIRSTNVIESVFATVRLRTAKTKGCGTRNATVTMVFKLMQEAQKTWRKIYRWNQLRLVHEGRKFRDGVLLAEEGDAVA